MNTGLVLVTVYTNDTEVVCLMTSGEAAWLRDRLDLGTTTIIVTDQVERLNPDEVMRKLTYVDS